MSPACIICSSGSAINGLLRSRMLSCSKPTTQHSMRLIPCVVSSCLTKQVLRCCFSRSTPRQAAARCRQRWNCVLFPPLKHKLAHTTNHSILVQPPHGTPLESAKHGMRLLKRVKLCMGSLSAWPVWEMTLSAIHLLFECLQ